MIAGRFSGEIILHTFSTCMQCLAEGGLPNRSSDALVRIPDDGVIKETCDRGHRTVTIVQQMKFELLSDMAIKAIVDGYYRDAVASFMGTLERLYEFFIQATCRKHCVTSEVFDATWRDMAKQSERQLGAFLAAYVLETGRAPKLLPQRMTEFRNGVIHKGKFPEPAEAISFGQAVVECSLPILDLLKSGSYSCVVEEIVGEYLVDRLQAAQRADTQATTVSINCFLSLTNSEQNTIVESAVAQYRARPEMPWETRE